MAPLTLDSNSLGPSSTVPADTLRARKWRTPAIGEVVRAPDELAKSVTASLSQSPVEVEGIRGKFLSWLREK